MNRKLIQLETLRGAAAVYVLAHHLVKARLGNGSGVMVSLFSFGQEAVILFFVISGFVIYYSTSCQRDCTFSDYFVKRWVRIYPIFIMSLAVSYLLTHPTFQSPSEALRALLGNLFMLQDLGSVKPGVWVETFCGNSPLWSLSYEWWFYMLFFPVFKFVPAARQQWVAYAVSVAGLVTYLLQPNQISRFAVYFAIWWAGVEMARTYVAGTRPALSNQRASLLALGFFSLSFVGFACWHLRSGQKLIWGAHPVLEARHFCASVFLIVVGLLWAKAKWRYFENIFGNFRSVAHISYGLYILHFPITVSGTWLGVVPGRAAQILIGLAAAFGSAWFAEVPFQSSVKRLLQRCSLSSKRQQSNLIRPSIR